MPTGYTAPIEDGSITTLREYALRCVRAFGVCVDMRDDPMGALPPARVEPHTYHRDALAIAEADLENLLQMTPEQQEVAAYNAYTKALERHQQYRADEALRKSRYEHMAAAVSSWEVPGTLSGLRDFMLSQIHDSTRYAGYDSPEPVRALGPEWWDGECARLVREIEYHRTGWAEERQRTSDKNAYLDLFWAALPSAGDAT
jgi:hypothetical protein